MARNSIPPREGGRPRGLLRLLGLAAVVCGAAVVGWAAASVLSPAEEVLDSKPFTYVTVAPGEVGSSINLNAVATWAPLPAGSNQATGIVTSVSVDPGDEISQGSILYAVNLRPVVVARGDVPAFREIGQNTSGPDVAQVQEMLSALGFYDGAADGEAGPRTVAAIKSWQKSLDMEETGLIQLGEIIFVPILPTRVSLDAEFIARGAALTGGEEVVRGLPTEPTFVVPVTDAQAAVMPLGTAVEITGPNDVKWNASVSGQTVNTDAGTITIDLQGMDGSPICGDQCGLLPLVGESLLSSRIVTVPTVAGLVVPSSALVTSADGRVEVIDTEGKRVPVTVVASARGMTVIEGASEGTRVRVPAKDSP